MHELLKKTDDFVQPEVAKQEAIYTAQQRNYLICQVHSNLTGNFYIFQNISAILIIFIFYKAPTQ